ncbi:MAG: hypothetical protein FD130_2334, partial [Halothiobacillaceae bacterium]
MTYQHLVAIARNIASVCESLHHRGYVIGDVNFKNWMVIHDSRVTVIDTDSFQVHSPSGRVHCCEVVFPGYRAPELKGKIFKGATLTVHQDAFGLGVLLFQLLVDGNHPTRGLLPDRYGSTEEEKIDNGAFPWGKNRPADQEPVALLAPLYEALTPELQRLFEQCFRDGYTHYTLRPSAARWRHALDSAFRSLIQCSVNKLHWYFPSQGGCIWCAFDLKKSG